MATVAIVLVLFLVLVIFTFLISPPSAWTAKKDRKP